MRIATPIRQLLVMKAIRRLLPSVALLLSVVLAGCSNRGAATRAQDKAILKALKSYQADMHALPAEDNLMVTTALLVSAASGKEYLSPSSVKLDHAHSIVDEWGNAYEFKFSPEGERMSIRSAGPDGRLGTNDDIVTSTE